jgi:hypothetical protein
MTGERGCAFGGVIVRLSTINSGLTESGRHPRIQHSHDMRMHLKTIKASANVILVHNLLLASTIMWCSLNRPPKKSARESFLVRSGESLERRVRLVCGGWCALSGLVLCTHVCLRLLSLLTLVRLALPVAADLTSATRSHPSRQSSSSHRSHTHSRQSSSSSALMSDSPPDSPPDSPVLGPQPPRPASSLPWIEK